MKGSLREGFPSNLKCPNIFVSVFTSAGTLILKKASLFSFTAGLRRTRFSFAPLLLYSGKRSRRDKLRPAFVNAMRNFKVEPQRCGRCHIGSSAMSTSAQCENPCDVAMSGKKKVMTMKYGGFQFGNTKTVPHVKRSEFHSPCSHLENM